MTQPQINDLADAYTRQLTVPEAARQQPQFALCVIGLVGAGKTTILKQLCNHIPMVRVSGDEIRDLLRQNNVPYEDSTLVINIGHQVSGKLKQAGYNIAHDNDFSNPVAREALRANNQKYGVCEVWIRIRPPEDWILARLRERPASGIFATPDEAIANYFKRKELQAQNPWINQLPFVYEFDPSKPDIDEQIKEAVRRIQKSLEAPPNVDRQ